MIYDVENEHRSRSKQLVAISFNYILIYLFMVCVSLWFIRMGRKHCRPDSEAQTKEKSEISTIVPKTDYILSWL